MTQKFTYVTGAQGDARAFHAEFDRALLQHKAKLGGDHPLYIGGVGVRASTGLTSRSPIDGTLLGSFASASAAEIDSAVRLARESRRAWERRGWQERGLILGRAAALIRERKVELSAL